MTRRQALRWLGRLGAALGAAVTAGPWPAHGADAEPLRFAELYAAAGPLGLRFAERALALRGRPVAVRGFLAPPLKPEAHFFVLSARPVALCPFCQSDADWPHDIVVIYPRSGTELRARAADLLEVTGVLELGSKLDAETGFVSQVRLVEAGARPL